MVTSIVHPVAYQTYDFLNETPNLKADLKSARRVLRCTIKALILPLVPRKKQDKNFVLEFFHHNKNNMGPKCEPCETPDEPKETKRLANIWRGKGKVYSQALSEINEMTLTW